MRPSCKIATIYGPNFLFDLILDFLKVRVRGPNPKSPGVFKGRKNRISFRVLFRRKNAIENGTKNAIIFGIKFAE